MNQISLTYLKYFYDSATELSLAKAARRNHVSQSAISQAIRKLEELLEVELLVHQKNHFKLTQSGMLVLSRCQAIFGLMDDLRNEVRSRKRDFSGTVSLASSHSIALSLLPEILKEFKIKYPKINPKFKLGSTSFIREWVERGEVEIGLTIDDGRLQSFDKCKILEGKFCIVSAKKNTLPKMPTDYLLTAERPETLLLKRYMKDRYKRELSLAMEVDSWEIISQFAAEGLGLGFIPDFILKGRNALNLVRVEEKIPEISYDLCAFYKKKSFLSRNSQLFLELANNLGATLNVASKAKKSKNSCA